MDSRIYKLSIIPEYANHRDWDATIIKAESCWVLAQNEDNARLSVHLSGSIATKVEPGMPVKYDPWQNGALTMCQVDEPGIDVPEGVIVISADRHIEIP